MNIIVVGAGIISAADIMRLYGDAMVVQASEPGIEPAIMIRPVEYMPPLIQVAGEGFMGDVGKPSRFLNQRQQRKLVRQNPSMRNKK